jgi:hypothetical protein
LRVREQHSLNAQLGETKARPEEDQSGPPAVECPVAEEEEGRSSLRSEGGCSSAWLVEANSRSAASAAGGASGRFTSMASGSGEQRYNVGGRARAREMAMVLVI